MTGSTRSGSQQGFSAAELVVVLGIVGVLLAMVVPATTRTNDAARVHGDAQEVANRIRRARMYAITRQDLATVVMFPSTAEYVVTQGADSETRTISEGVRFESETMPLPTMITFDGRGMLTAGVHVQADLVGFGHSSRILVMASGIVEVRRGS